MERGIRKELIGVVVSDKMDKTRVVAIESWKVHPIYKKRYRSTRKIQAHDEGNISAVGDKVRLAETRPLSRHKRWRISEVIEKSKAHAGGDQR
ncbi:MAG: 30S ribosomal protein S17 [Bacillota bacterium]|jgi:small subunit ribosomal protein S17|nr:30S ribosomal protein S17 [Candidatus Fermentithermobacillaceae bacterium]